MKENKHAFCTLFDKSYLLKGLALHNSLLKHCPNFVLYIFPFDKETYMFLKDKDLKNTVVIKQESFESKELLTKKKERSIAEYCWTCTPVIIEYVLSKFHEKQLTYLDADLYFFSNPEYILNELSDKDHVLITEHNYTKKYDKSKTNGKFCVQFITFRDTKESLSILNNWKKMCLDWCFSQKEEGKFGDQKYLDEWPLKYSGVHIMKNIGGGLAPWNIQQYRFFKEKDNILVKHHLGIYPLIFFHFHQFTLFEDNSVIYCNYPIPLSSINILFKAYKKQLLVQMNHVSILEKDRLKQKKEFCLKNKARALKLSILSFFMSFYLFK